MSRVRWPNGTRRRASPRGNESERARRPLGVWLSAVSPPSWPRALEEPPSSREVPWLSSLALLAVQQVGSGFAAQGQSGQRLELDALARLLLAVGPLLLLLRHSFPRAVAVSSALVTLVYLGAGYPHGPVFLSVAVACFSAAATGHRAVAGGALGLLWLGDAAVSHLLWRWLPPPGDAGAPWGTELATAAFVVAILALAELARVRRTEWLRRRAREEEAERRRADEERLRIARELHDVLAHSLSVINVQAGVGLALLDSDPSQARTALTTVKSASKEALGEVRQVLDTLRAPGDAPRTPAPGLDSLDELVRQSSEAGLRVTKQVEGREVSLPAGVELAAFRVVQEALTNVVRHSGSPVARIALRYRPRELRVRVEDDGPALTGGPSGGGNGLTGMRERAAALGGTVSAGPYVGGGFRVVAHLPTAPAGSGPGAAPPPDTVHGQRKRGDG